MRILKESVIHYRYHCRTGKWRYYNRPNQWSPHSQVHHSWYSQFFNSSLWLCMFASWTARWKCLVGLLPCDDGAILWVCCHDNLTCWLAWHCCLLAMMKFIGEPWWHLLVSYDGAFYWLTKRQFWGSFGVVMKMFIG